MHDIAVNPTVVVGNERTKPVCSESIKPVISKQLDGLFLSLNDIVSFIGPFFSQVLRPPYEFRETIRQCHEVGVRSLPLI